MLLKGILLLLLLCSCKSTSDIGNIHSLPDAIKVTKNEKGLIRLTFAATSNLGGRTSSRKEYLTEKYGIFSGGIEVLQQYLKILRAKLNDELILIDAGNIVSDLISPLPWGDLESFKDLGYDGVNLTSSELNFYLQDKNRFDGININFFSSNIIDLKTGKEFFSKTISPNLIIKKKGIKIGIIGVNDYTQFSTLVKNKIKGIVFNDPVQAILKAKIKLQAQNVDLIVLVLEDKSSCHVPYQSKIKTGKQRKKLQINCSNSNNLLENILKRMPPNSIDLIIAGNGHISSAFSGETPILQAPKHGRHFGLLQIFWDQKLKRLNSEKTRIFPAIKTCHQFFASTKDCHIEKSSRALKEERLKKQQMADFKIIPATFLGEKINL